MNQLVTNYTSALQALYDHVGFVEDWVIYPVDPQLDMFWKLSEDQVVYAKSEAELESETGNYYESTIVEQCFYKKYVYEGAELTLIFTTQHVDGMSYFSIFDNSKKR